MFDQATASLNAMRVIDLTLQFFGPDGEHWLQGAFRQGRERRCLVDAMAYLRRNHSIRRDNASWHIYEVVRPRIYAVSYGPKSVQSIWSESQFSDRLMFYNDNHCKSFAELCAVLIHARNRAAHDAAKTDSERQAEIIAAKAADERKQAAAAARWQLISGLEVERKSASVRWITRDTYILCPPAPAPIREPQRLAA